jgi:hypothetical protein
MNRSWDMSLLALVMAFLLKYWTAAKRPTAP